MRRKIEIVVSSCQECPYVVINFATFTAGCRKFRELKFHQAYGNQSDLLDGLWKICRLEKVNEIVIDDLNYVHEAEQ